MIRLISNDGVAVLEINRPEKKNAITRKMQEQFHEYMEEIQKDLNYQSVLLIGSGMDFCAGGDLDELKNNKKGIIESVEFSEETSKLYQWKYKLKKPIISAVDGYCLGMGMLFAAMSHVCIATENSKFGLPEIKFGLAPMGIFPYLVPALGTRFTLELALTGRITGVHEIKEKGLVHYWIESKNLREFAIEKSIFLSKNSAFATKFLLEASEQSEHQELLSIKNLSQKMLLLNYLDMQ